MEDAVYFDGPFRRIPQQEYELINSQSSGYSSTDGGGKGYKLPLPRPESLASASDQGSVIHNYSYYNCMVHQHLSPRGTYHHVADDWQDPNQGLHHHMRKASTEGCLYVPTRPPTIISPGNRKVMESHMPALLEGIDPLILLPYLHKHRLVSRDDADEISHPNRTKLQRNLRIIYSAPYKDSGAFERFIASLEEAEEHPCHRELARLLQEGNKQMRKPDILQVDHDTSPYKSKGSRKHGRPKKYLSTPNLASDVETDATVHSKPSPTSRGTPSTWLGGKFSTSSNLDLSRITMDDRMKNTHAPTEDVVTFYCMMQKLKWLQDNVRFRGCKEEIVLTSKTNHLTERRILHSGVVFQNGNPKVAVLCSDFLLLLKPARDVHWEDDNGEKSQELSTFEWFSNNKYNAKKPLLLKFLDISEHPKEKYSFKLHYQPGDLELTLTTSTEAARNFWIKVIDYSIEDCKRACMEYFALPTQDKESHTPSGEPFLKIRLTLLDAINLRLPHSPDGDNHHLFCTVRLGQRLVYRTPTAVGRDRVAWSYKMEFSDFATFDVIHIVLIEENHFRPNESVGSVQIPVSKIPLTLHELEMDFPLKRAKHTCGKIRVQLGMGREINV